MTQITKEAIEAGLRITLSSVNIPAGECLHETDVREILEAALPFLPIAGGRNVPDWLLKPKYEGMNFQTFCTDKEHSCFSPEVQLYYTRNTPWPSTTLPIAVEGKVKQLEWDDRTDGDDRNSYANTSIGRYEAFEFRLKHPSFGEKTFFGWRGHWTNADQPSGSFEAAKAAAQADYETRILSALISSPGKDGGQEVEAAEWQGRYWIEDENRWSNWITNPVGYPWAHEPQEGKSEIRYLYPQPASTALVERLTSALLKAEEVLANYADPTGYTDGYGDPVPADAVQHEGLLAQEALDIVRSTLSASTSREGER